MIADPQAAVGIMVVSAAYVSADRVVRWTGQWGDGIAVAGRLAGVKTDRRRRSMKPSVVDVTVRTAAGQCGGIAGQRACSIAIARRRRHF